MDKTYDVIDLFQNTLISNRPRAANFNYIIKLEPYLLQQPLNSQKKVKIIRNYVLKIQYMSVFLNIKKIANLQ